MFFLFIFSQVTKYMPYTINTIYSETKVEINLSYLFFLIAYFYDFELTCFFSFIHAIWNIVALFEQQRRENIDRHYKRKHTSNRNKYTAVFRGAGILILRIDGDGTDFPRVPGIVSRISSKVIDFDYTAITIKISVRVNARLFGNHDEVKDIETVCNWNGKYNYRRWWAMRLL